MVTSALPEWQGSRRHCAIERWGRESSGPEEGAELGGEGQGPEKGSSSLFLVTEDFHPALLRRGIKRKAKLLPLWFVVYCYIGADSTIKSINFSSIV